MSNRHKHNEHSVSVDSAEARALHCGFMSELLRPVQPQPVWLEAGDGLPACWSWEHPRSGGLGRWAGASLREADEADMAAALPAFCPYGNTGDLVAVREAWCLEYDLITSEPIDPPQALYRADGGEVCHIDSIERSPWQSATTMPLWASRMTLRVTGVQVQRVHSLSLEAIFATGLGYLLGYNGVQPPADGRQRLAAFWDARFGRRGTPWSANPWVWRIAFEAIPARIDHVGADQSRRSA